MKILTLIILTFFFGCCFCARFHQFPVYVQTQSGIEPFRDNNSITFPLTADSSLESVRSACKFSRFIEIEDCQAFHCTNATQKRDSKDFFVIEPNPVHKKRLCSSLPGAFESRYPSLYLNISTVYKVKSDDEFESTLDQDSKYCGCISAELFEISSVNVSLISRTQSGSIPFNTFFAVTVNDYVGFIVANSSVKYRIWDMSYDCQKHWLPWSNFHSPTSNYHSPRGYPLYSKSDCEDLQMETVVRTDNITTKIDEYHFTKQPYCLDGSIIDDLELPNFLDYVNSSACIEASQGFNVALISNGKCLQANFDMLPTTMETQTDFLDPGSDSFCKPCDDDSEKFCGSNGETLPFYSAYVLDDINSSNTDDVPDYKYFQCVTQQLYNDFSEVLPGELYLDLGNMSSALECLKQCSEKKHEMAFINLIEKESEQIGCLCTTYYKFSERDIRSSCLNHWCPGVTGPCVFGNDAMSPRSSLYSAVYCLKEPCDVTTFITSIDNQQDICIINEKLVDPFDECSESYFQCVEDDNSGRMHLIKKTCPKDEVFDEGGGECKGISAGVGPGECDRTSCKCRCFDDRDQLWVGDPGMNVTKDCYDNLVGSQFWYCPIEGGSNGFEGNVPNRLNCTEKWIGDIENQIESNKPSDQISDSIGDYLNDENQTLSEGGIVAISSTLGDLLDLRKQQAENGSYPNKTENGKFAKSFFSNFYKIITKGDWASLTKNNPTERDKTTTTLIETTNNAGFIFLDFEIRRGGSDAADVHDFEIVDPEGFNSKMSVEKDFPNSEIVFGDVGHHSAQILLPSDLDDAIMEMELSGDYVFKNRSRLAYVGTIFNFKNVYNQFPNTLNNETGEVNSIVLDLTLPYCESIKFGDNEKKVEIIFQHEPHFGARNCVFWNVDNFSWSTEGCAYKGEKSSQRITVCECNHLTTFTLIFGNNGKDYFETELLSYVLGGLSCAGLLVTQIFILFYKQTNNQRKTVELNRNLTLMLALALFIFIIDLGIVKESKNSTICTALTFLTHFMWLAAFAWTALEGYLLYRALVVVFDTGEHRNFPLYIFGYGLPIVLTTVTFIVALLVSDQEDASQADYGDCKGYCNKDICWLNEHYVWGFIGPLVCVILFNLYILFIGLRVAYKATEKRNVSSFQKLRTWARNCIVLTFLLGITWIFGFPTYMTDDEDILFIISIVFTALNASSGIFIFFYTVVFSRTFMDASKKLMQRTATFATKSTRTSNNRRSSPPNPDQIEPRVRRWTRSTQLSDGNNVGSNIAMIDASSSGYGSSRGSDYSNDDQLRERRSGPGSNRTFSEGRNSESSSINPGPILGGPNATAAQQRNSRRNRF